ncbi:MAG: threonylcarbamoyl-AMP synthase [Candidatus Wildermuthbacteria bacterium]|nr:threonylcarbamoyl-AMP synthase [Candidatus Wildermuthbacteria bacterium]
MRVLKLSKSNRDEIIKKAILVFRKGGIIVSPTDTVYGLLGDALNPKAIRAIFKIKKRRKDKPLGVFVRNIEQAKRFAKIAKSQEKLLRKSWPGQFTFILESRGNLPKELGSRKTIGMRSPDSIFLQKLLTLWSGPLVQTSANISGKPASDNAEDIAKLFSGKSFCPGMIIDGGLSSLRASTVIDLAHNKKRILRK